jgi:hypothetical protein
LSKPAIVAMLLLAGGVALDCSPRDGVEPGASTSNPVATVGPDGVVPWADLPLPLHPIKAAPPWIVPSVSTLPAVRAGDTLEYQLSLRNEGGQDYAPTDCPVYVAWLQDESPDPANVAGEPLTLNCLPAGHIAPGATARFAMEFWIPQGTPPGHWQLVWGFASSSGTYGRLARSNVEVLAR